jgi:peptidoglycan-N-acetylglucosamine deacetylase
MRIVMVVLAGLGSIAAAAVALPGAVLSLAQRSANGVVFRVDTEAKVVGLSIDDGPAAVTAAILALLAEHDARATFFVIGEQVQRHPELTRQILADGHELGHHMMRDQPSIDLAPDAFLEDFATLDSILTEYGGSTLFRPGSGWFDQRMIDAAAKRGYQTVLGSVYPFDAQLPFPGFARWYIRQTVAPGSIIILHDGEARGARTMEVLREILPDLRGEGYRVVPVSELLAHEQQQRTERAGAAAR